MILNITLGPDSRGQVKQAMGITGQPMVITSNDGTEFTSNVFDQWAYRRGIELDFIAPGRRWTTA